MRLGIEVHCTDYSMRPDELARACEERGFESLWFSEHTHIPAGRQTNFPPGGDMPQEYYHLWDLFVALSAAAVATETLIVGSGICLPVEHDPISMAKAVASVDLLSNGRVVLGVGGGWNAEEMANHGTPYKSRWRILRERIEAMKEIWTQDEAEYHGEFVDFDPIWSYPKPVQKPHPPILLGSNHPNGMARVVQYCDGWIPNARHIEKFPAMVQELNEQAEKAGRHTSEFSISVLDVKPEKTVLEKCQEMGAERSIFFVPSEGPETLLPLLDGYAKFIPEFV